MFQILMQNIFPEFGLENFITLTILITQQHHHPNFLLSKYN